MRAHPPTNPEWASGRALGERDRTLYVYIRRQQEPAGEGEGGGLPPTSHKTVLNAFWVLARNGSHFRTASLPQVKPQLQVPRESEEHPPASPGKDGRSLHGAVLQTLPQKAPTEFTEPKTPLSEAASFQKEDSVTRGEPSSSANSPKENTPSPMGPTSFRSRGGEPSSHPPPTPAPRSAPPRPGRCGRSPQPPELSQRDRPAAHTGTPTTNPAPSSGTFTTARL